MIAQTIFFAYIVLFGFSASVSAEQMRHDEKVAHAFDRLSFGARPGDVEKLRAKGPLAIQKWIEEQLNPNRIEDSAVEKKLSNLSVMALDTASLLKKYRKLADIVKEKGMDAPELKQDKAAKRQLFKAIGKENLPEEMVREMRSQKIVRAVESRRQLQEILLDFWFNHFNVDIKKNKIKWVMPDYERKVLRPRLFGKFADLLKATAESPAMLMYLDQQQSVKNNEKTGRGLNENYAREIMELHTLGVDAGYTQKDVTELARILTGWSLGDREDPEFLFRERQHDGGEKIFLGERFEAGHGKDEGDRAIAMIARHPATAKHIAYKLVEHFVSDEPPKPLVEHLAKVFHDSDGDLRAVYQALFASELFWDRKYLRAKVKKPLHYMVSAIRALGGEAETDNNLQEYLSQMGEDIYGCPPPTGYRDRAEFWVNPGAMVSRLNFAAKLTSNRIDGVLVQLPRINPVKDPADLITQLESVLLHEKLSPSSRKVVSKEFEDEGRGMADGEIRPSTLAKATALTLASPEFQRR